MTAPDTHHPRAIVVGTGFGCRVHVPALRAAGFEVAGVVGTDPARTAKRAAAAGVAATFADLDAAIAATGATAVTIATPPHTHLPLALAAIGRGCHVLCEKPLAADADEAAAMLAAAEQAGVVHLVANEFRWAPDRATVARAIAEGRIGTPRLLTLSGFSSFLADPAARMQRWWFDRAAGGGWLGAQGSHVVDQVRAWLGDFASLSASLPSVAARGADAAEDSYVVRFTLANGVEGVLQQSAATWGPPEAVSRIAGTEGTAWIDKGEVRLATREGIATLPPVLALPTVAPDRDRPAPHELPPFVRLAECFAAAIRGEATGPVAPPTFADGLAAMRVIDAIRRSAAEGGRVVTL